jgi:hypothetical protein
VQISVHFIFSLFFNDDISSLFRELPNYISARKKGPIVGFWNTGGKHLYNFAITFLIPGSGL